MAAQTSSHETGKK